MNVPFQLSKWFTKLGYNKLRFIRNNGRYYLTYTVGTNPNPINQFGLTDGFNFYMKTFEFTPSEIGKMSMKDILDKFIEEFGGRYFLETFTEYPKYVRFPSDRVEFEIDYLVKE